MLKIRKKTTFDLFSAFLCVINNKKSQNNKREFSKNRKNRNIIICKTTFKKNNFKMLAAKPSEASNNVVTQNILLE